MTIFRSIAQGSGAHQPAHRGAGSQLAYPATDLGQVPYERLQSAYPAQADRTGDGRQRDQDTPEPDERSVHAARAHQGHPRQAHQHDQRGEMIIL